VENVVPFPSTRCGIRALQAAAPAAIKQACCEHVDQVLADVVSGRACVQEASENLQMLVSGLFDQISPSYGT
jgi:hypothetical protein